MIRAGAEWVGAAIAAGIMLGVYLLLVLAAVAASAGVVWAVRRVAASFIASGDRSVWAATWFVWIVIGGLAAWVAVAALLVVGG